MKNQIHKCVLQKRSILKIVAVGLFVLFGANALWVMRSLFQNIIDIQISKLF